jgi:hypothetical protein
MTRIVLDVRGRSVPLLAVAAKLRLRQAGPPALRPGRRRGLRPGPRRSGRLPAPRRAPEAIRPGGRRQTVKRVCLWSPALIEQGSRDGKPPGPSPVWKDHRTRLPNTCRSAAQGAGGHRPRGWSATCRSFRPRRPPKANMQVRIMVEKIHASIRGCLRRAGPPALRPGGSGASPRTPALWEVRLPVARRRQADRATAGKR